MANEKYKNLPFCSCGRFLPQPPTTSLLLPHESLL